jgi:hypothetical protein
MNLFLALFWLLFAVVLVAYEQLIGETVFRIRFGGANISGAWLMLGLGLYNLARWWSVRAYRAEQRALEIARASREREMRRRFPSELPGPPDPNFNFTDEPPPARGVTDQPPSNN